MTCEQILPLIVNQISPLNRLGQFQLPAGHTLSAIRHPITSVIKEPQIFTSQLQFNVKAIDSSANEKEFGQNFGPKDIASTDGPLNETTSAERNYEPNYVPDSTLTRKVLQVCVADFDDIEIQYVEK